MKEKLIITAALAGGATTKHNNPNTPYLPEEFAEESYKCLQEGVSIVHIHAKTRQTAWPPWMCRPTGTLSGQFGIVARR